MFFSYLGIRGSYVRDGHWGGTLGDAWSSHIWNFIFFVITKPM